eukprot:jgi/Chlat1/1638/Chrsp127S01891
MAAAAAPPPLAGRAAVSRGYSFVHTWEQNAPLTDEQLQAVSLVADYVGERPLPQHLESGSQDQQPPTPSSDEKAHQFLPPSQLSLQNSHQFYKWHAELEAAMNSEMEEKYQHYAEELLNHLRTFDSIISLVDETLQLFEDLQAQHRAVATKTRALSDACEQLVQEKERLAAFADALRTKLNYFDELEKMRFFPMKLSDGVCRYVSSNPQYADSSTYLVKFKQLQARALGLVRTHVLSVLRYASAQVQAAVRESGATGVMEGAETSLLYVRFRAAAPELKGLMEEMEARGSRKEYAQLLTDCHALYCSERLALVAATVQERIAAYAAAQPVATLTRSGCAYLMQVCQLEHQLFEHFFPSSSASTSVTTGPNPLAPLLDPLCTVLYDALRPLFVHEQDLDLLCELVEILRGEVLEEHLGRRGEAVAGLRPTVERINADVQERLIFRAQTFMRDEVATYTPTPDDLDYPAKLERIAAAAGTAETSGSVEDYSRDMYAGWYPPLERTLSCLSKLYRTVDVGIFTDFAQEAVTLCSSSIQLASRLIMRKAGTMDGQLFLIKHLLILREQIAPFDIDFAVTYRDLDFSHMRDHLRRIMRGETSFFNFMAQGAPRVTESMMDSKKDLEKALKATCEAFIMSMTKLIIEPMLSFITKVTAVKLSSGHSSQPLREQAFASPERLKEMIDKVREALETLPGVMARLRLYLTSPSTRAILLRPIKSNISEAYTQIANLVGIEYNDEDRKVIGLISHDELNAKLDLMV